jgi:ankyrin repeat protein
MGDKALVEVLLATEGVDTNSKDVYRRTPLSFAAMAGHGAVVELLLSNKPVAPDAADEDERTPLSLAAGNEHEAMAKLLLGKVICSATWVKRHMSAGCPRRDNLDAHYATHGNVEAEIATWQP